MGLYFGGRHLGVSVPFSALRTTAAERERIAQQSFVTLGELFWIILPPPVAIGLWGGGGWVLTVLWGARWLAVLIHRYREKQARLAQLRRQQVE